MGDQPRFLVLGELSTQELAVLAGVSTTPAPDAQSALSLLDQHAYAGVVAGAAEMQKLLEGQRRDAVVLANLDKGVAVLDEESRITWANPAMLEICQRPEILGKTLMEALGATTLVSDVPEPLNLARHGTAVAFRIYRPQSSDQPYLDVTIQPVQRASGGVEQQVVLVRNITSEVEQQRKLDALHQAGRELADLDPEMLAEMNIPSRVELLKQNLRRYIHDLLRYDIIEVRLLDRRTGELRPLLEDGMTPTAARRVLYAREEANGVTGYVAARGQSYVCVDTANDPLYLEGASGARSSMTVPLKHHDEVVGTLNVESPTLAGFGAEDLQFAELFSKEIATALHTLDLLTAQQTCAMSESVDRINREIAMPIDEVLASTALLIETLSEGDPVTTARLARVLAGARQIKENLRKVERDMQAHNDPSAFRSSPLRNHRVLVLDQDERIRRAAHLMLGQLGAEVETVSTALEAVAVLKVMPFDAVLMEIRPIDLGGYETYSRLRQARPDARISMTTGFGYDSAHAIVKARAEGMQFVLFKPFRQDQVLKAVLETPRTPEPMKPQSSGNLV
ncbi:MAG: response regulator [Fimbriiglobus sp.]